MIDRQKVYNRVRKHLLAQGEQALRDSGESIANACAYRSYDPKRKKVLKCAVGCLIPFRHYDPNMEGQAVYNGRVEAALMNSLAGFDDWYQDTDFLTDLQTIHDEQAPEDWQQQLDVFAVEYGLKVQA